MQYRNILCVTKKPPKIFTAAKIIARKPNKLEVSNILSYDPDSAAIIAPTIITDEIAFVTDMSGVCKEGVTLKQRNNQRILIR